MVQINWGLTQGNNFQNALATGMQMGAQARQAREEKEYKNALAQYDPSNPETIKPIMAADPRVGIQLQRDAAKQQAETQQAEIQQRAAQGDPQAMAQLAGLDLGAWRGLQADQKANAAQQSKVFGNAALDILNRPPEQRAAVLNAYIDQFGNPELERYRGLQGPELEQALRSVVAQADMIGKLHEMEQPKYMAVDRTADLVNVRDPAAVASVAASRGGQVPPPPPGFVLDEGGPASAPGGFPGY